MLVWLGKFRKLLFHYANDEHYSNRLMNLSLKEQASYPLAC